MSYRIIPATEDLLRAMAPHVRAADRREVESLGHSPESGLLDSFRRSLWSRVALTPAGQPLCAWGLGLISTLGGIGGPWMLSTPLIDRHRRLFLRESRRQVAEMQSLCPILRGLVDARYREAVRWLGWLGFRFATPIDINGAPFLPFELR